MTDCYFLTPYFLDQPLPGLLPLAAPGWTVNELAPAHKLDRKACMTALHQAIADRVDDAIRNGQRPVSIAGDCVASLGVLASLQHAGVDPLLVWFDAHGDFNTWETTPSGFLGGMPLAMLVGRGEQTFVEALNMKPLPENQVILTDARDLDPGEKLALAASGVRHLPKINALLHFDWPERPIYVHFDTDVLDPSVAPAQNYLAAGGASMEELGQVFRAIARTGHLAAVSMSTWNPVMDNEGRTQAACMNLLEGNLLR